MKKLTGIAVVGLLLVALVVYLVSPRSNTPLRVGLGFAGYSTDTNGQVCATFNLTNQSDAAIRRCGFLNFQSQKQRGLIYTVTLGPDVTLAPGKSEMISTLLFSMLTNLGTWRGQVGYERKGMGNDFRNWVTTWPLVPNALRGVPVQMVESQWIDLGKKDAPPQPIATGEDKTTAHLRPPGS